MVFLGILVSCSLLFTQTVSAASTAKPTIAEGSTGQAVYDWQQQLNEINSPDCDPYINLGPAVQTDSDFGPLTLAATRAFQLGASNQTAFSQSMLIEIQKKNGGPINLVAADGSADGVVGPLTHKAMDVLLSLQVC
jgi:hypothetical protein